MKWDKHKLLRNGMGQKNIEKHVAWTSLVIAKKVPVNPILNGILLHPRLENEGAKGSAE